MLQIVPLVECKWTASRPGGIYPNFHLGKSRLTLWHREMCEPECVSECCRVERYDGSFKTKSRNVNPYISCFLVTNLRVPVTKS